MRGPAKGAGHGRPAPPRPYKPSQLGRGGPGQGQGGFSPESIFSATRTQASCAAAGRSREGAASRAATSSSRPAARRHWGWGWGSARPAPPRLPSPGHSCCVGLRLQRWNKTALLHYFFCCLFVHLNVYSELHFVKPLPALFIPQLTEVFTFQISRTRL